ncbi:10611_t:CDS:1, partial [Dentiscutata erythropus]
NARRREKRRQCLVNGQKCPRAPNRFILYRTWHQNHTYKNSQNPIDMRSLSKKIAEQWKNEPLKVKSFWDRLAAEEKLKAPYRTTADILSGLEMSISKHLSEDTSMTFVNATVSSQKKNFMEKSSIKAENEVPSFVFISPESPPSVPEKKQDSLIFEDPTLNTPDTYKWEEITSQSQSPESEILSYDSYGSDDEENHGFSSPFYYNFTGPQISNHSIDPMLIQYNTNLN